jgi:hypothetical protein
VALELVVNRALHRNLNYRFQTPGELIAALSHVVEERIYKVRHALVLASSEHIRALLAAPVSNQSASKNLATASATHAHAQSHSQRNLSQKQRQLTDGLMISPAIALPTSALKQTRLASDSTASDLNHKPLRSIRGFLTSTPTNESKTNPKPLISPLERNHQYYRDEKPEAPARNTDIIAMAQDLHLMMRRLQASLK